MNDPHEAALSALNMSQRVFATYREVIAEREAAETETQTQFYEGLAERLRSSWAEWRGEDSLHELAFADATFNSGQAAAHRTPASNPRQFDRTATTGHRPTAGSNQPPPIIRTFRRRFRSVAPR